jgi:hypothetical protein
MARYNSFAERKASKGPPTVKREVKQEKKGQKEW